MIRVLSLVVLASCVALQPAYAASSANVAHVDGVTIVSQPDPSSSLVGVEFAIPAGLDRQGLREDGLAALVAESILKTPVDGVPLDEAVAAEGGSVHFTIEPTGVRFYCQAVAFDAQRVFATFRSGLAAPDFSQATLSLARDALIRHIATQQHEPLTVAVQMLDLAQASGNNTGFPALGTPASLMQLTSADASAFYRAYYRRDGSSLSAVGRVDALGSLEQYAATLPQGASAVVQTGVKQIKAGSRELLTHRDVNAPWLVVQYGAPVLGSRDYGPMLVLAAFLKHTLGDIAELPGTITPTAVSDAVGAVYDYDAATPSLVLYVDGGIGDYDRTFGTALTVVNLLSTTKLEGSIDEFKRIAASEYVIDASVLETRARLAGMFARRTGSADYLGATLEAIEATTPQDVQRVARRYLGKATIALVLPRAQN